MLNVIASSFRDQRNLSLTEQEFVQYDKFIDDAIKNGDIIKHDEYDFTAYLLAQKINALLNSDNVKALESDDKRIDYRAKGQGIYFLINNKVAIMTFSLNAIAFFPAKT